MPRSRTYITTTIPYVNARPHLGFALELVQADVLARHRRARGDLVRFQAGTDENSLKNVLAAEAAGMSVREFVDRNAAAFLALREPLDLSVDDTIRTSRDPRHRAGVERLWHACADAGDLYPRYYEGLYCVGCEQFRTGEGLCEEHDTPPQRVAEENWFFRLSRYAGQLHDLISGGSLRIEPAARRNEVLAFIEAGLEDFSVSRSTIRARGWGIPVPGDPGQVIYVWWDALGNYITALGYGLDGGEFERWWSGPGRRVHLVGKGVVRFHAVYWPAMLLSAGLPLPTDILVHDYLTAGGRKISKSGSGGTEPAALAGQYGTDAVRWWLLREVPRTGDADFTPARLAARADDELANGIGNLVRRVASMVHRYRDGRIPAGGSMVPGSAALAEACKRAPSLVDAALAEPDFRKATTAVLAIADEANRFISETRPWRLAPAGQDGAAPAPGPEDRARELDDVLALLCGACRTLAARLEPFLPDGAARIRAQFTPRDGRIPEPFRLYQRITHFPARIDNIAQIRVNQP